MKILRRKPHTVSGKKYKHSIGNNGEDIQEWSSFEEKKFTRLPVSPEDLKKAEKDGVVQKRPDGGWGIIAIKKKLWWDSTYSSKEKAEAALRAYHAQRH